MSQCINCNSYTTYENGYCSKCYSEKKHKTNGYINHQPSEGEEYIMEFLKDVGIKYECEKKILDLKNDTKQFRVADFYLPQYDTYVEFYGLWNKNIKDGDYKEKKEVYSRNGKACVYLYPENLGVLHFTFDKRLQKELIRFDKKKELRKYKRFKFLKAKTENLILLTLFLTYFICLLCTSKSAENYHNALLVTSLLIAYQCYLLFKAYRSIYIKMNFSLLKVLDK